MAAAIGSAGVAGFLRSPFLVGGAAFEHSQNLGSPAAPAARCRRRSRNPAAGGVRASLLGECAGMIGGLFDDHHRELFLGVGVGLPCTVMECGDIIYRSSLPRPSGLTLTAPGVALALAAVSYLWATPGVAPGFFDMFVLAFVERLFRPTFRKVGRSLTNGLKKKKKSCGRCVS